MVLHRSSFDIFKFCSDAASPHVCQFVCPTHSCCRLFILPRRPVYKFSQVKYSHLIQWKIIFTTFLFFKKSSSNQSYRSYGPQFDFFKCCYHESTRFHILVFFEHSFLQPFHWRISPLVNEMCFLHSVYSSVNVGCFKNAQYPLRVNHPGDLFTSVVFQYYQHTDVYHVLILTYLAVPSCRSDAAAHPTYP
jgi:hypothetical protein